MLKFKKNPFKFDCEKIIPKRWTRRCIKMQNSLNIHTLSVQSLLKTLPLSHCFGAQTLPLSLWNFNSSISTTKYSYPLSRMLLEVYHNTKLHHKLSEKVFLPGKTWKKCIYHRHCKHGPPSWDKSNVRYPYPIRHSAYGKKDLNCLVSCPSLVCIFLWPNFDLDPIVICILCL